MTPDRAQHAGGGGESQGGSRVFALGDGGLWRRRQDEEETQTREGVSENVECSPEARGQNVRWHK